MSNSDVTLKVLSLIHNIERKLQIFYDMYKERMEKASSNVPFQTHANEEVQHVDNDNNFFGEFLSEVENRSASPESEFLVDI